VCSAMKIPCEPLASGIVYVHYPAWTMAASAHKLGFPPKQPERPGMTRSPEAVQLPSAGRPPQPVDSPRPTRPFDRGDGQAPVRRQG
jgi:hypothetical protein